MFARIPAAPSPARDGCLFEDREVQTPMGVDPPTRQQLDELDALMQRMLALPVHQAEEDSCKSLAVEIGLTPATSSNPAPSVDHVTAAEHDTPYSQEFAFGDDPDPSPEGSPIGDQAQPDTAAHFPILVAPRWITRGAPRALVDTHARPEPVQKSVAKDPVPWWLAPAWCLNWLFEALTCRLGPVGRAMQSPLGRMVLGTLGILSLLSAVGWAAMLRMGWTW